MNQNKETKPAGFLPAPKVLGDEPKGYKLNPEFADDDKSNSKPKEVKNLDILTFIEALDQLSPAWFAGWVFNQPIPPKGSLLIELMSYIATECDAEVLAYAAQKAAAKAAKKEAADV